VGETQSAKIEISRTKGDFFMKQQYFPYAFFEGKVVKTEDAKISIMTNALQYGTGVFAGIRGYYNPKGFINVFRIEDHFERFLQSLQILGVTTPYTKEKLVKTTIELLKKNKPKTDMYIRPFTYAGSINLSPNLQRDNSFDVAIYMLPLGEYLPVDKGISAMVSSWRRISDNAIPSRAKISGSYINSALARQQATKLGFDEAILLTEDGHVAEGSAENLFIVRNETLITADSSDDVLEGITRRTILKFAKDLGIPTEVRRIDRSELYIAEEAFFSGTGVQIAWISQIDSRVVGDGKRGKITQKISQLFFSTVRGNERKYKTWCTQITI